MNLHNPFLDYKVGDDFLEIFHRAAGGEIDTFLLVIEGSIPNEENKPEGYWSGFGSDKQTNQAITICEWIDSLAEKHGR